MAIVSEGFLLLWFPIGLWLYWQVVRSARLKLWFLGAASFLFYALAGPEYVPLLLGLSLATFGLALRGRFAIGIGLNLLALGLFKYWNFGADNLNRATGLLALPLLRLALPLGISFYVFKHIGYLLDVRQKRYPATRDLLAFATYSAFFPQISAGPLSSFGDTGRQLRALPSHLGADSLYEGLTFLTFGLAKKLLIADALSRALAVHFFPPGSPDVGLLGAWFGVLLFAFQIYFDFSGYTDIALGLGILFGVTLPPNFDNPYLATSPAQFWQRWHISLSLWFRTYLFTPLSRLLIKRWGPRHLRAAQGAANLITMGLVGLWHGAAWGFILWGLYHGLLLTLYAWISPRRRFYRLLTLPSVLFAAVLIGWALFLSPDLAFAGHLLKTMAGLDGMGSIRTLLRVYSLATVLIALAAAALILAGRVEAAALPRVRRPVYAALLGSLALLAILHLDQLVDFLYVQF